LSGGLAAVNQNADENSMNNQNPTSTLIADAWQCFHSGHLQQADGLCRQLLALDPKHAEAYNLLGTIAHRAGNLDAALAWMSLASQADPQSADYHNNLGVLNTFAGRLGEAALSYRRALELRPDFAQASNNLSYALYHLGQFEEARACSEKALRLQPNYAEAHNHLGLALMELGQPEEAAEEFQKALQIQPGLVAAYHNLGSSLELQGQLAAAVACYEKALNLNPQFVEVHINMGDVFKKQGRFEQAIGWYERALQTRGDYAFAYWNLGQFAAQGLYRFSEEALNHVRDLSRDQRLPIVDRSLLHLMLGDVLDRRGAYDEAFGHYRQGNDIRRNWLREIGRVFNADAHHKHVDQLMATFDEKFFEQPSPAASNSETPIFVVGMPRSGSTLVVQILSSHSQVVGGGELRDITQLVASLNQKGQAQGGYPGCLPGIPAKELRGLAEQYLGRLARLGGQVERVIDKMPDNFLHLGVIAHLFPRARVIHCHRDPLDTCMSCYFQNFKGVNYSWSLEDLGHYHRDYERLMAHWKRVLPLQMLDVSYEDLVARQEAVTREMVAFCGLDWEDRCLAFQDNPRVVQTVSAVQVRRPMYSSSIGRWKKYAAHLEPLRRALGMPAASAVRKSTSPRTPLGGSLTSTPDNCSDSSGELL